MINHIGCLLQKSSSCKSIIIIRGIPSVRSLMLEIRGLIEFDIHSTGGTGYIGGSVLNGIVKKFPALQVTALVRSEPAGFKNDYPTVSTVLGDFDSFDVIKAASQDADIIIRIRTPNHQSYCICSAMTDKLRCRCWRQQPSRLREWHSCRNIRSSNPNLPDTFNWYWMYLGSNEQHVGRRT